MMMSLCEYSALNDCAILSIMNGDLGQASSLLSKCIKQLGHLAYASAKCEGVDSLKAVKQWRCIPLPWLQDEDTLSPSNICGFYPVLFSLPPPCHNGSVEMFEEMLAASMMFNLAVLSQQNALTTGCSRRLKCSLNLYQLVVRMLQGFSNASSAKVILLFAFANMAQIHGHFRDMDQAYFCIDCAYPFLEHVEDYLPEEVVYRFESLTTLLPLELSPAPAA